MVITDTLPLKEEIKNKEHIDELHNKMKGIIEKVKLKNIVRERFMKERIRERLLDDTMSYNEEHPLFIFRGNKGQLRKKNSKRKLSHRMTSRIRKRLRSVVSHTDVDERKNKYHTYRRCVYSGVKHLCRLYPSHWMWERRGKIRVVNSNYGIEIVGDDDARGDDRRQSYDRSSTRAKREMLRRCIIERARMHARALRTNNARCGSSRDHTNL